MQGCSEERKRLTLKIHNEEPLMRYSLVTLRAIKFAIYKAIWLVPIIEDCEFISK